MKVFFVTKNRGKLKEAEVILSSYGIEVKMLAVEKEEIQSYNLEEIALHALRRIDFQDAPFFVEDAGLFIEALNGFPGPYSSYVYKTIGCRGILKLLEGIDNRKAYFLSVVALKIPSTGKVEVFKGKIDGFIADKMQGEKGFGFDPIFMPDGYKRTFAEMSVEEKNRYSHRGKALRKMGEWIVKNLR
ncbi:MAG: non-canonical purine NTP pyrophosphatase, RdgB/HAM1 family [Thermoprotei archaeon]|nr:MAG: non-canonical purine NTP pyrophosphatase, RdgB/HAM1 family [Thermoprotei archaeon]